MDASRIKLDTAALHLTGIQLKETVLSIVDLFEPLIEQERRTVICNVESDIRVQADETCLKQVLHNLLSNALRYSPAQTSILITAEIEDGDLVRLSISDQGDGIPLEKQAIIFEKFVRLERDTHGEVRGTGLGLFITRQLVEAMCGTISVVSSGVKNEGATFSLTLPLGKKGSQ
jgi:signal transduction histidine kinase